MKVQVLKEVNTSDASEHSAATEDNQYYATLDGHVIEVYRDVNSDIDSSVYVNADNGAAVYGFDIRVLRQIIWIEV